MRGKHRNWVGEQEVKTGFVKPVIGIDVGVERANIDNQGCGVTSPAKISSIRSEISLLPTSPGSSGAKSPPSPQIEHCIASRVNSDQS